MTAAAEADLFCSFCGTSQAEVQKLIAGPGVYICDRCIDLCNTIIADSLHPDTEAMLERLRSSSEELDELVQRLKDAGVPWERIAEALRGEDDEDGDTT